MDMSKLNYLAIFVAALASFALGSIWYSPVLFVKTWLKETGIVPGEIDKAKMARTMGFAFVLSLVMSFNLAAFLSGPNTTFVWGMTAGALAGIGWVAAAMGINYLYEGKSLKLFLINAGYLVVSLILMGGIIGAWR